MRDVRRVLDRLIPFPISFNSIVLDCLYIVTLSYLLNVVTYTHPGGAGEEGANGAMIT